MASVRDVRAARAVELAAQLLALSRARTTPPDEARARMLARMMHDAPGRTLTAALTDRFFRSVRSARRLDAVAHLLARYGVPRYMRPHERAALTGVRMLAGLDPPGLARAVEQRIRAETRAVLLDAEDAALTAHLAARHREGVRVNVNQLGEALLGEREAEARVAKYCELAERPDIDALSVKVSSIASQLEPVAFEASVTLVSERLARIYAASVRGRAHERPIVMLDMESYAHVPLTLACLARTLADPALDRVRAGVVVQAYLPEAGALFRDVRALAEARVARGGMPLRVRIVKGANLASERVDSSKAGVQVPIFAQKREVDASYKRLLERALTAESTRAVQIGVASHNLFDLAYALLLCEEHELTGQCELELLEGMADPVRRALAALGVPVLVYAPICHADALNSGIAYLVRRLDENTAPENYLNASFDMRPESPAFERERARFLAAIACMDAIDLAPRRAREPSFDRTRAVSVVATEAFCNEPDTDFTRAENRAWVARALSEAREAPPQRVVSRIAGVAVKGERTRDGDDPSRPGHVPYRIGLAEAPDVEAALACAARDPRQFSRTTLEQRAHLLVQCAGALRRARAALIATMVLDGGKRVAEADVEVSEAIDFAAYYRASTLQLVREHPVALTPRGVVLVTPPWNFPLAIAAGGIFAALMAGCRVLFKPALETPQVGAQLAALLWEAGVPEDVLQLVVCEDEVASALVRDPRVNAVILTGATSTARLFQRMRPGLRLLAETGGKNAYVVSAMSDRELAIRDAVTSAFGHAGQKCSAASLLICEAEVYDDPRFMEALQDAVESLPVGAAWEPTSFVTPLIRPPEGALAQALAQLEPGESWLVAPKVAADNPRLVSPGVKLGVAPGSFTHTNELFGPVLGVMRAESLDHAVTLANATGYGLTAGLASLDEREQARFVDAIAAGNVYVNRTITGAIVRRQPFGGVGKSGFGPGAKAGGPNYVAQLCHLHERRANGARRSSVPLPEMLEAATVIFGRTLGLDTTALLRARAHDYLGAMRTYFEEEHDPSRVLGQENRFRYLPCPRVILRFEEDASLLDLASSCIAARISRAEVAVSVHPRLSRIQDTSILGFPLTVETSDAFARRAPNAVRVRVVGTRTAALDAYAAATGAHLADDPVIELGRFELLHYLREQTLSIETHRYGSVPLSATDEGD
ncbi:MAG: bifunctional proline dehydrogenase/L-glutamate gamma-semialdehyde dehydrogenase [Polyangiales bacterium]